MKKSIFLIAIASFLVSSFIGQTNDSPLTSYTWKGKKTTLQKGYVVLKSGKKLEGQISLKGNASSVTHVQYLGDGKDFELPTAAVLNYGVYDASGEVVKNVIVEKEASTKDLFKWRTTNEAEGRVTETTKPRSGYVVLLDGNRIDGEIQLKRLNGTFKEIKLKTDTDKHKFKPSEVQDYGLSLTIAELTKDGAKVYKDEAKNFSEGSVTLINGEIKKGLIAFSQKGYSDVGTTYNAVMYAESQEAVIRTFEDIELSHVTKMITGEENKFTKYDGGFVNTNELDDVSSKNVFKMLNTGKLTLKDGSVLAGEIMQIDRKKINYKDASGNMTTYTSDKVERIDVKVGEEEKALINVQDFLIEEMFSGNTFLAYVNPVPTHVNQFKTNLAKTTTSVGTSVIAGTIVNKTAEKGGYTTNLDSVIANSSTDKLKEINNGLYQMYKVEDNAGFQDSNAPDDLKNYESAISLAIAGREASNEMVVYYRETILINKKTGEEYLLYNQKSVAKDQLEGLLMGCYTFLSLDKAAQKPYYSLKNIKETAKMLDECY